MTDFYRAQEIIGRKEHICEQCMRPISIGTRHRYSAGKLDGDFNTYREHLECHEVWLEIRKLRELSWDESSEFLHCSDDLDEDRAWIIQDHPIVGERLFGSVSGSAS